ncbi:hypothetical protein [Corynebacterium glutamicum]|nr:hypothetical protein [Corynebacterium glutamicum]
MVVRRVSSVPSSSIGVGVAAEGRAVFRPVVVLEPRRAGGIKAVSFIP